MTDATLKVFKNDQFFALVKDTYIGKKLFVNIIGFIELEYNFG